jgi:hypothetical protein
VSWPRFLAAGGSLGRLPLSWRSTKRPGLSAGVFSVCVDERPAPRCRQTEVACAGLGHWQGRTRHVTADRDGPGNSSTTSCGRGAWETWRPVFPCHTSAVPCARTSDTFDTVGTLPVAQRRRHSFFSQNPQEAMNVRHVIAQCEDQMGLVFRATARASTQVVCGRQKERRWRFAGRWFFGAESFATTCRA